MRGKAWRILPLLGQEGGVGSGQVKGEEKSIPAEGIAGTEA